MKANIKAKLRRLVFWTLAGIYALLALMPKGLCSTGSDMTSTITEWLPIILQFAIIGMIFGMLKKFGRW